jgi:outer membrane protein OmpA-like peptidoglycan-associated protein
MIRNRSVRLCWRGIILVILLSSISVAQTVKIQGLITARSGPTVIVKTSESPRLIVLLTDSTEVGQIQGVLKARRKQMSMAALIPGLAVQIEGAYDTNNQIVAKVIKFSGDDLKRAESVQAGLHETREEVRAHEAEIAKHQEELEKQNAELKTQTEALKQQQEQVAVHQQKIAANKAAIDAAIARFGQLDDYYIFDEVTVYFENGKVNVEPQYKPQLLQLAQKAKEIQGYMIEIRGFASAVGSAALNQKLSEDRANSVTQFLIQQGRIPLTNMLAPGAMGETEQVGHNRTSEGQAANRRVVVRILQNKGVAGLGG